MSCLGTGGSTFQYHIYADCSVSKVKMLNVWYPKNAFPYMHFYQCLCVNHTNWDTQELMFVCVSLRGMPTYRLGD